MLYWTFYHHRYFPKQNWSVGTEGRGSRAHKGKLRPWHPLLRHAIIMGAYCLYKPEGETPGYNSWVHTSVNNGKGGVNQSVKGRHSKIAVTP